jgi:hypothetical protein
MCCIGDMLHARIFDCIARTAVGSHDFDRSLNESKHHVADCVPDSSPLRFKTCDCRFPASPPDSATRNCSTICLTSVVRGALHIKPAVTCPSSIWHPQFADTQPPTKICHTRQQSLYLSSLTVPSFAIIGDGCCISFLAVAYRRLRIGDVDVTLCAKPVRGGIRT